MTFARESDLGLSCTACSANMMDQLEVIDETGDIEVQDADVRLVPGPIMCALNDENSPFPVHPFSMTATTADQQLSL
jgi:hypothetical protein